MTMTKGIKVQLKSNLTPNLKPNNVRNIRESKLMSKSELAKAADLSIPTIDRVEKGHACRMETKRKIIKALGMTLDERKRVFLE
jgi:DNA-binding XRE family transcriptional regulator